VYSPQGGQIRVELAEHDDHIQVKVEDQGIGIPAAALPQIWQRFFRAPNVDPLHISGFGVGLYVVHEIVRRHGGSIAAVSADGQGSTFTMHLPRMLM
jgi:signal transduction histidine kinase